MGRRALMHPNHLDRMTAHRTDRETVAGRTNRGTGAHRMTPARAMTAARLGIILTTMVGILSHQRRGKSSLAQKTMAASPRTSIETNLRTLTGI